MIVARKGSTSNCKLDEVVAAREEDDDKEYMDFKIKEVLEAKQDLVMQPGDIVSVMSADFVYVYGNVNKQGKVTIKEPITLTQAIVSSEGLKPSTNKDEVRVFRQKPGSVDRDEFVYDLNAINKRRTPDPYLEPNDIVAVSEDKAKSIFNAVRKSLTQGIPSILYRVP
ncbi:MAG: hypothetical protein ACT4O9_08505 [Blastocatellia bacterium]